MLLSAFHSISFIVDLSYIYPTDHLSQYNVTTKRGYYMSKSRIITLRVSDNDLSELKKRADTQGVTMSDLLKHSALANDGLSTLDKQRIYAHLNIIKDSARQIVRDYEDIYSSRIIKEADDLWQLLS